MTAQITMQCRQGRDQTGPFPGFGILEHTRFFLGVNLIFFDNPKILPNIWILQLLLRSLRKRGGLMMMMLVRKNLHEVCEWSWWYKQIQWNARCCCYAQDLYDKEEVFSGDEGKICKNCTFHPSLLDCFMILWCLGAHKVMSRLRFFFNKTFVMFSFRHLYSPAPVLLNCLM